MNRKKILCATFAAASFLICQSSIAAQDKLIFKNERGSVLEFSILENNKIEGHFTTAVASPSCPQAIGKKQPIIGYTIGNAMTFSVVYPMCDSLLTVSGNFDKNKKGIDTISILNKQSIDITHEGPGARFIGHDFFKKVEKV